MNDTLLRFKHWQLFLMTFAMPMVIYFGIMGMVFSDIAASIGASAGGAMSPRPPTSALVDPMFFLMDFIKLVPIVMLVFMIPVWCWYWSLGVGLQKFMPVHLRRNLSLFKIIYFIPPILMMVIVFIVRHITDQMYEESDIIPFGGSDPVIYFRIILLVQLILFICTLYITYFASKNVKIAELKRKVTFADVVAEFLLLWIFPVGVWMIQPEVNKLVDTYTMDNFDL